MTTVSESLPAEAWSGSPFQPFLEAQGAVVLDGGLATTLEAAGHDLDHPLWSARVLLDDPGAVRAVHRAFLDAGSDCIATATYQASVPGLVAHGLTEIVAEGAIRSAVDVAVEERDRFWSEMGRRSGRLRPLVAASVGPYGAFLADGSEYRGDYGVDAEALDAFHRRRWRLLADSPADLLACETIPCAAEIDVLLELLRGSPGRWAWISLQCRDPEHLADGTPLADVVPRFADVPGLAAVGVNCVAPDVVLPVVRTLARARVPVAAYPNSGEAYRVEGKRWEGTAAVPDLVDHVGSWLDAGARVVGGCCRVGPDTIRRVRARAVAG